VATPAPDSEYSKCSRVTRVEVLPITLYKSRKIIEVVVVAMEKWLLVVERVTLFGVLASEG